MKFDIARQWARRHAWSLGIVVAVFLISSWTVRHFKRPGQMTVIESQAMDMTAMRPPVGSVPVATEFVARRPFSTKVRYTGSVAPYNEQNIYPRVEGWLTGLKVYNGDSVRSGQLLAVLDSPDVQNKLSEATHGHIAASREVPIARSNRARMQAELDAARGGVQVADREVDGARARLTAAQKMVSQAEKGLKSARASLNYWKAEFKREANLLKEGAVSQQEFDSEQAQMIAAEAEVENKRAKVEESKANVEARRAELSSKQAQTQIAGNRVSAAEAALSAATGEISQKAASASRAGAARATAATFDRYRQIRAPFAGVVTKRYLSPGVLVNPGMAILNIAQIDRVRLQANVAEKDLASIAVGAEVTAHTSKGSERTIHAAVTSISPLADQTSRTAIVEAIIDNRDHSLIPGDFVSMEIATSSSRDAITVPSRALTSKDGRDAVWVTRHTTPTGNTTYYCTMHPEVVSDKPGLCPKCNMKLEPKQATTGKTAHLVYVTIGRTDGERTEILFGLKEGDEVIYAGRRYLREGDAVTPTKWGTDGPAKLPPPAGGGETAPVMHEGHGTPSDSDKRVHQPARKTAGKEYTCPMHPEFVTSDPNALCPECNMKLEPKKE